MAATALQTAAAAAAASATPKVFVKRFERSMKAVEPENRQELINSIIRVVHSYADDNGLDILEEAVSSDGSEEDGDFQIGKVQI
ncbi:hypothetical protein DL546_003346 [Coniochaeta pulveracea]|uniref:Uncharacterized protein n=1 Tax=Coniochaeta pulveracea TaxID=177199 RepID=A0A420Y6W8_9PEZI|nr:hypothetical protein DL546_003346 [Coniochaeta pulveracea]